MIPTSVRQPANNNGWYLSNILITENIKMLELEFSFLHDFHQLPAETTLWPLNKFWVSPEILNEEAGWEYFLGAIFWGWGR